MGEVNKPKGSTKPTQEEFISRVTEILPELDFTEAVYINAQHKVTVYCKHHGKFESYAKHLVKGHGCKRCGQLSSGIIKSKPVSSYIDAFNEVHDFFYSYDKAVGSNSKARFIVDCPIHGEFTATVSNHLKGKGCPKCGEHKCGYRSNRAGTFYILNLGNGIGKFGISNCPDNRIALIKSKSPLDIKEDYRFTNIDGQLARNIECDVISDNSITKGVVDRSDLPSGFTETFNYSDLPKILEYVYKHMPA